MTIEEEKKEFRNLLKEKDSWKPLMGTEFEDLLTTYICNRGEAARLHADRLAQEFFPSIALNRESILAKAEFEGYIPRLPRPFRQKVTITNNGSNLVSLAEKQAFVSDGGIHMVLDQAVVIPVGNSETVDASQLLKENKDFVTKGEVFEEFILSGQEDDGRFSINSFDVYVGGELWENSEMFRNGDANSTIYITFYRISDELAIRLGNGHSGKLPAAGTEITVDIWKTLGDQAAMLPGVQLKPVGTILDISGEVASIDIRTSKIIEEGLPLEDIESIRKGVQSHEQMSGLAAKDEDYEFLIKKTFPDLIYLKCWGEQQMQDKYGPNLAYINRLFYSFLLNNKNKTSEEANADIASQAKKIDAVVDDLIKPLNIRPQHVPMTSSTFQIEIQGRIDRAAGIVANVEGDIRNALLATYGENTFRVLSIDSSDIYDLIISLGYFKDYMAPKKRIMKPFFKVKLTGSRLKAEFYSDHIYLPEEGGVSFGDDAGGDSLDYVSENPHA
jgi:hypothetical protein